MRKLDEGLQYIVYDEGDKVKKKPKSRAEMVNYLKKFHESEEKIQKGVDKAIERREKIESKFKNQDLPILPDFKIKESLIIQNKLEVTKKVLEDANNLQQKKNVIDSYIDLVKECWKYGVHDMSYNFMQNTGMNEEGKILQLDLGDLIFSKERIKKEVKSKKWIRESVSYTKYMSSELKPYYEKRMNEEITPQNLETNWREKKE